MDINMPNNNQLRSNATFAGICKRLQAERCTMKALIRLAVVVAMGCGFTATRALAEGEEGPGPLKIVPKKAEEKDRFAPRLAEKMPFFVFNNAIFPPVKNFALSGYMGDISDIKITGSYSNLHQAGFPALKVSYAAAGGMGWAGVVWQNPANNWGEFDGGYNLSAAKKISFWVRGEKGGEIVEFKLGGTASNYPDSDNLSTGDLTLTDKWQQYQLDLSTAQLFYMSAGFGFICKQDMNPGGCVFYLDDIRYEE